MKLIGKKIDGQTVIVNCVSRADAARATRVYAKAGVALRSYETAIKEEADRLVNRPDDPPKYKF